MIYWVMQIGNQPPTHKEIEIWELLNMLNNLPYKDGTRFWIETRRGNE